jgi:hypothetical protein
MISYSVADSQPNPTLNLDKKRLPDEIILKIFEFRGNWYESIVSDEGFAKLRIGDKNYKDRIQAARISFSALRHLSRAIVCFMLVNQQEAHRKSVTRAVYDFFEMSPDAKLSDPVLASISFVGGGILAASFIASDKIVGLIENKLFYGNLKTIYKDAISIANHVGIEIRSIDPQENSTPEKKHLTKKIKIVSTYCIGVENGDIRRDLRFEEGMGDFVRHWKKKLGLSKRI